jgi:carbonic anhydrase/acetyltransferase-like protein (isoleucine patch superfamily)
MTAPEELTGLVPAGTPAAARAEVLAHYTPQVDPAAFVAPGVTLIGRVELAARASVWYGTVIRADGDLVSIGEASNLQDGTVVHSDPGRPVRIGRDVSVGHRVVVHGCTIEDEVLVGMGAVVLNDVVIGTGSIVAAGAVVREGTVIPPRSLVAGVPARVRRDTTDTDLTRIRNNALAYVRMVPVYRAYLSA